MVIFFNFVLTKYKAIDNDQIPLFADPASFFWMSS